MIDAQGIQEHEMPECLKGKLEFGNTEQIETLKKLEKLIERKKQLKKYEVELYFEGYDTIEVEALNEEEAKEIAMQDFDINEAELELIVDRIKEL